MSKTKQLPKGIREKNGSYEARATVNGIKIEIHGKDLEKLKESFELAKDRARKKIDMRSGNITLDEWFEKWFNEVKSKKVKQQSIAVMKRVYVRTFGFYIGSRKLNTLTTMDFQEAINAMNTNGIAISTLKDSLSRVRECMEFAVADRMIEYNPCIVVEVPWSDKRTEEEIPFTQDEQDVFLDEVDLENNWYTEMFYVMFLTGMRVGEIGALRWEDIDFKENCFHIRGSLSCSYLNGEKTEEITSPKTVNSYRSIPFIGEAAEMLRRQEKKVNRLKKELGERWRAPKEFGNLVFVTTMGSPCTRYIVQKEINKVVNRINDRRALMAVSDGVITEKFRHAHPHLIRHTFATRCFEAGIDPKVVQALMGHSTISTTLNIYTHVLKKKQMEEVSKFGQAKTMDLPNMEMNLPNITAHSHI